MISRFSEDIDITIFRDDLGEGATVDELEALSGKKRRRRLDAIKGGAADTILLLAATAYNFAKRLKTLKGLTPYEYICKLWTRDPERFTFNPLQQTPGLI